MSESGDKELNMGLILTNKSLFPKDQKFPLRGFFYMQRDMEPHQQEFNEVTFITGGKALHYSEPGGWEETRAGDVWIIPAGGTHGYMKTKGLQIFNLLFIADRLPVPLLELYTHPEYRKLFSGDSRYWKNAGSYPRLKLSEKQLQMFLPFMNAFAKIQNRKTAGRNAMKYGLFMTIISGLCDISAEQNRVSAVPGTMDISRITRFLNEHYSSDIGIRDLMKLTAMSESTLRRHFRKFFGVGPVEYIRNFRLNIAAGLLLNTTYSIKEVSQMCGFTVPSYFCKQFREVYNLTPLEYRNQN